MPLKTLQELQDEVAREAEATKSADREKKFAQFESLIKDAIRKGHSAHISINLPFDADQAVLNEIKRAGYKLATDGVNRFVQL